jgi:predicted Zn-dependent protease with MMP-like domain
VPDDDQEAVEDGRWDALVDAINLGDYERAEALIDELTEDYGDDTELMYERAVLLWERDGPASATATLDELLARDPEHADAHYLRGLIYAEAGSGSGNGGSGNGATTSDRHARMVEHFLATLRLDALESEEIEDEDDEDLDFIESTAEFVLAHVPAEFGERLRGVPIVLEPRPHPELVREGFDPRSLGLFEGLAHGRLEAGDSAVAPTRIVLYYANLLADFPDHEELADEIEITILHEIGHFFGLDEDDLERLGLE